MSLQHKKQNSQKTRDDSVRPKSVKPSTSTGQTKKSAMAKVPVSSDAIIENTKPAEPDEKYMVDRSYSIKNHQAFLIEEYINQTSQTRQKIESNSCKKVLQNAIAKLQVEIKQREKDLSNLSLIRDDFNETVTDAEEKIHMCETFENELKEDYASMIIFMTEKMKTIGQTHAETNAIIDRTINQQKFFDRESQLREQKLDKVNTQIDFVTKKRDETAIQISQANKIISEMTHALTKLRKSNNRLKEQIDYKRNEKEANNEVLITLKENIKIWIKEKNENLHHMKKEKNEMKKFQASLLGVLANMKDKCKDLDNEYNELTMKTAEQEKLITRVKTANKNLYNDDNSKLEFDKNRSLLSEELDKLRNAIAEMENERDKKQEQCNDLKRVREEILKKQQSHDELESNLAALKKENADIVESVSNSRKKIDEMKSHEVKKGQAAVVLTKRIRLSSITSTDDRLDAAELVSNASSINLKDFGIDSEYGNEFDSFTSVNPQE